MLHDGTKIRSIATYSIIANITPISIKDRLHKNACIMTLGIMTLITNTMNKTKANTSYSINYTVCLNPGITTLRKIILSITKLI